MGDLFNTKYSDSELTESNFTNLAKKSLDKFIRSDALSDEADATIINNFLLKQTFNVSFGSHLKRYIRHHHDFKKNKHDITDNDIIDYLCSSFKEHEIPPKPAITSRAIKGWLTQRSIRRSTMFSIGFGLDMSADDVSTFLVKVLNERDFDFSNKEETVYHYCFQNHYGYSKASWLLENYSSVNSDEPVGHLSPEHLKTDREVCIFLNQLEVKRYYETNQQIAFDIFSQLLNEVRTIIADTYNKDYQRDLSFMGFFSKLKKKPTQYTYESITDYDIEQALYNAIPLDKMGNLQKMLSSNLKDAFRGYRLTRQRMSNILLQKQQVERFDLLTLLFYVHARNYEGQDKLIRGKDFIDHANEMLSKCNMMQLYVTNSYEAFLLLCLLDEYPLNCFSDVWESSYGVE